MSPQQAIRMKSLEFRRERESSWTELDVLLARVEKEGIRSLDAATALRLPTLYRAALSSLSVARAISLDRNVVDYLESLTGRAYFCVYGTHRHLREAAAAFFGHAFPDAVRRFRLALALAAFFMVLGVVAGFLSTRGDPERFYAFVGEGYAQGRGPSSTTAELRAVLYAEAGSAAETLSTFASFLFTHNAGIGILAFALGFAVGFPVFILMTMNGLTLGAFAALYHSRGLAVDFWGWVLPHGVTELSAVVLCGAGGLVVAHSLVFPGRHTRLENLARQGREAGVLVLGAVVMLFLAGLVEGVFRQTVHSVPIRYAVAMVTAIGWSAYFGMVGRRR